MSNKLFASALEKLKSQYVPTKDTKLRITLNGDFAAPHGDIYTTFANGELTEIPAELTIPAPIYLLSKPIDQIKAGDVIKTGHVKDSGKETWTYHKVEKVADGKITTKTFGGNTRNIVPIKDFFLGQKTVQVAINLLSGICGGNGAAAAAPATGCGINPMVLLALGKDGGDMKSLLPLMMMQNGGVAGANGINPMLLLAMNDEDGDNDFTDILLMSSIMGQGGNALTSLFGTKVAPVATAASDAAPAQE